VARSVLIRQWLCRDVKTVEQPGPAQMTVMEVQELLFTSPHRLSMEGRSVRVLLSEQRSVDTVELPLLILVLVMDLNEPPLIKQSLHLMAAQIVVFRQLWLIRVQTVLLLQPIWDHVLRVRGQLRSLHQLLPMVVLHVSLQRQLFTDVVIVKRLPLTLVHVMEASVLRFTILALNRMGAALVRCPPLLLKTVITVQPQALLLEAAQQDPEARSI
jgi:hypothetical protein